MALKILSRHNDKTVFQFDNVIPIWSLLKHLVETPYLKQYIVKDYEGGNTLAPKETWNEEGILYKEIGSFTYFFPYESIGFVVDDSIHNLSLYAIDFYHDKMNYQDEALLCFKIQETDLAQVTLPEEKENILAALYILSAAKLGFDYSLLDNMSLLTKSLLTSGAVSIEYIKGSITIGLKGTSLMADVAGEEGKASHYKIHIRNGKCKKEILKDEEIKNFGFFKKKILSKNKYFPYIYYGLIGLAGLLILIFNKKLFVLLLVLLVLTWIVYLWLKKNAYRLFRDKTDSKK
jgi:hypothetical protein